MSRGIIMVDGQAAAEAAYIGNLLALFSVHALHVVAQRGVNFSLGRKPMLITSTQR